MGFIRFTLSLLRNSSQRKHFFRWLKSFRRDYLLKNKQPWLTFDTIDYLNSLSLKGSRIFEYGSGGSTLFWLNHGAECVSVEHNPDWHKLMCPRLEGMDSIDYRVVLPEPSENIQCLDISDPNMYISSNVLYWGYNFRNYVCQIDASPDEYFDIVLIDGRARPSCIVHSVKKVKVGGMIILDNSDRDYYLSKTRNYLDNFEEKEFRGAIPTKAIWSATTIFTRTFKS